MLQTLLLGLDTYLVVDKTNTVPDIIKLSLVGETEVKLKGENPVSKLTIYIIKHTEKGKLKVL